MTASTATRPRRGGFSRCTRCDTASIEREGDGEHGLADPGPEERDVGLGADELPGGQVADLPDVEVGWEGEVEPLEGLAVWQAGEFQCVAEPSPLTQAEFFFQEEVDEVEVAHLCCLGTADELG